MRSKDLLIEIGAEELPPSLFKTLITDLGENIGSELENSGFRFRSVEVYGTARRLAAIVRSVNERQEDKEYEKRGPSVEMAYDKDGEGTPALKGFLRACGITDEKLLTRSRNAKGEWLVYKHLQEGKRLGDRVQDIVDKSLERLNINRPMRWGSLRAEFVRPVHWVVALYGDEILEIEVFGCKASNKSYGHRFMHPEPITITVAKDYVEECRKAKVVVDPVERQNLIRRKVLEEGNRLGGDVVIEEKLIEEVSALVEWPEALSGCFDEEFLEIPEDVLISVMQKHQRYFHLRNEEGKLLARFITIANIISPQPEVVVQGNERVIKPRLRDAQFFFSKDTINRLEEKFGMLERVTFQKELGSYKAKAGRISKLAGDIALELGWNRELAEKAGLLCKVDLVTNMVEEFPELQGKMGGHYARMDGEEPEVWSAIRDHYKPSGPGDAVPEGKIGSAVAIADKLDTLVGIFGVGGAPTGSKDPYALRRQTLGVIRIMLDHRLDVDINEYLEKARDGLKSSMEDAKEYQFDITEVYNYMMDRLTNFYQDLGIESDVVHSVRARTAGITSLVEADEAIKAIQYFKGKAEGIKVIGLSKRLANILSGHDWKKLPEPRTELYEHEAERALAVGLKDTERELGKSMNTSAKLNVLGKQGGVIADYFDNVLVMDKDKNKQLNRLAALARMHILFARVADFKILRLP